MSICSICGQNTETIHNKCKDCKTKEKKLIQSKLWYEKNKRNNKLNPVKLEEKQCTRCKETKPINEFNRSSSNKDGYSHWCKDCKTETAYFKLLEKRAKKE